MAKLESHDTVFQAKALALEEEISWASELRDRVKIWSDSESILKAVLSPKSRNPIIQDIQILLQDNPDIEVGLVRAHIGIAGNEMADKLAKKATKEGPKLEIPVLKSYLKKTS